jgi:uncharacterized membrane protein
VVSDAPRDRSRRATAIPVAVVILLLIGLWALPDLSPRDELPDFGYVQARAVVEETGVTNDDGQPGVRVRFLEGDDEGSVEFAVVQTGYLPGSPSGPPLVVGDEVVVSQYAGEAGGFNAIGDVWRIPLVLVVTIAFAVFVSLVGGWRGVRSLLSLALTLLLITKVIVPLLLQGYDPILLAVGAGSLVTVVTLTLTEGLRRTTLAASLGTIVALLLVAVIASIIAAAARFSAAQGSEEVVLLLPILGTDFDLGALLLAATVFGALGVLDDVTVTQAASVHALRLADPASTRWQVFTRAMDIGRSHIAATVNTLVLAYLGAGLPLLLLFAIGSDSPLLVANGELVAVEILRALAGSFGVVAAVPLATAIAAALLPEGPMIRLGPADAA